MKWLSNKESSTELWPDFAARYSNIPADQERRYKDSPTALARQYAVADAYTEGRMTPADELDYREKWRSTVCMRRELDNLRARLAALEAKVG